MIAAGADRSHRRALCLRAWLPAVIGTLILAFTAAIATAQAPASPASLVGVKIYDGAPGETRVLLTFNRILPQYSIVSNDNDHPTLGFGDTVRGSGAVVPPGAHGLLKSVEFNQRDSVLVISLVGTSAIHLATTTIEGRAVSVSITAASASRETATGPTGNLPQFVDRNPAEDTFAVVPLKYADISEVVGLLSSGPPIRPNDTFTPQEPAFGSSGFSNGAGAGATNFVSPVYNPNGQDAASTTYGQLVDDSIGVDRRLNAIILRGSPERVARLKEKIAQLDIPVQSVLLETVFVELTQTGAKNVGLDFNNSAGQIGVATYQYNQGGVSSGSGGLISDTTKRWGAVSTNLQAAIYDQVQKGEGRIISRPRISAQSGSPAKIITGDALPILTSIALSGVNAVSQQVQYVNVGVTLQIAPRVGADGYVTSHIFAEVSSVTGFSQGYPTISQREASTMATVKDGEYFVIGGLTQENSLTTHIRVGGLGDIPIVGEFFKHNDRTSSKTVLYIIVTPHIVRGDESPAAEAETRK